MSEPLVSLGAISIALDPRLSPPPAVPGLVWAEGLRVVPTASPPAFLSELLERVGRAGAEFAPQPVQHSVRAMLRHGKYRPSGRGKPASEFLLRAALGGEFPLVNGPVDVNNAVSLESGLPGSIFDADLTGPELLLRRGEPGEAYVFNPSGQSIDLEDLLVVCRRVGEAWQPCGNPVKDAMATKIHAETRNVVAVLYAPPGEASTTLDRWCDRFAGLLAEHCGAARSGYRVPKSA
ncbi:MAG: phenylalanine--tRNA ligase beta subunit-related protein [Candidatus Bipolaricaulis sp.]|nr:phenylalanine--tRNA ligase beta subunit-related protein [Candidatus Bipolaricaulis sp.]